MGIHRFRLSDILPNVWFNKLKNTITKTKNSNPNQNQNQNNIKEKKHNPSSSQPKHPSKITIQPQLSTQRKSYHFIKDDPNSPIRKRISEKKIFIDSPRKSSFRRRSTRLNGLNRMKPDQPSSSDNDSMIPEYGSSSRDLNRDTFHDRIENDTVTELKNNTDTNLPPITTKKNSQLDPTKIQITTAELSERSENGSVSFRNPVRRFSGNLSSTGVKLRTISPRIGNLRIQGGRKSMKGSRAVVKTSKNPERDFKDSMMVMIAENNIRTSKDLEDLLVWYLALNNNEYHDIIVNVFKQIWLDNIVCVQVTK